MSEGHNSLNASKVEDGRVWYDLPGENDTFDLGQILATHLPEQGVVYLRGQLGAGKTTLTRSLLRGLGHSGPVKSPTYTLVEVYEFENRQLYHFDLYRMADPEELEYLGFRDYFGPGCLCILEWPEKGQGVLPDPDLIIDLKVKGKSRQVALTAGSEGMQQVADAADRALQIIKAD